MAKSKIGSVRERVARGVTHLDRVLPEWFKTVNPERLRMREACGCVLGQCYGSYWNAPFGNLWMPRGWDWATRRGFNVPRPTGERLSADARSFDALDREWKRVIAKRRQVKAGQ